MRTRAEYFPDGMPEQDLPPTIDKQWSGWGVNVAEDLHQEYVTALEDWDSFQLKNDSKIAFWTAIKDLLIKAKNSSNGPNLESLYKKLGVHQKLTAISESDDKVNWNVMARLDETLMLNAYPEERPFPHSGNAFIDFGRELTLKREQIEGRAKRLVNYIQSGDPIGWTALFRYLSGEKVPSKGFKKGEPEYNPFYLDFYIRSYRQQVIIIHELTYRLAESHVGKQFLASLFTQGDEAIFNPFNIFEPPFISDLDAEEFYKHAFRFHNPQEFEMYFQPDGTVLPEFPDQDEKTDTLTEFLTELAHQLLPGLLHYDQQTRQSGGNPDDKVARFFGIVTSKYFTDSDINAVDPTWGTRFQDVVSGASSWTLSDVQFLGRLFSRRSDTLLSKAIPLDSQLANRPGREKWLKVTGALKMLTTGIQLFVVNARLFTDEIGWEEAVRSVRSVIDVVRDFNTVERFLTKDFIGRSPRLSRTLQFSKFVSRAAPWLDLIDTLMTGWEMVKEIRTQDYDSAVGYGVMALGGASITTAMFILASGGPVGWGVAILIGVAALLTALGYLFVRWWNNSELEELLQWSFFGNEWSAQADLNKDPTKICYRFRYPENYVYQQDGRTISKSGDENFDRQLSALVTLGRPIGVEDVEYDKDELINVNNYPVGTINLNPKSKYGNELSNIEITTHGILLIVPLGNDEENITPFQYYTGDPPTNPPLHKIRLGDWFSPDIVNTPNTKVPLFGSATDLGFRPSPEPYGVATDLPLQKWSATIWAKNPPTGIDHIFGFTESRLQASGSILGDSLYIEFVYVPPEVAKGLPPDAFRGPVEEWPIVSRERKKLNITWF